MSGLDAKKSDRKMEEVESVGSESDVLNFWLLLLFVAVFFGIAAEEARSPMFQSASQTATHAPFASSMPDVRGRKSNETSKKTETRAIDTHGEDLQ